MKLSESQYRQLLNKSLDYKINKYRNKKVVIDGIELDSKKEGKRYQQLKLLERAGVISNLELQKKFLLIDTIRYKGKTYPKTYYKCDFAYIKDGKQIIEDVKSVATAKDKTYRIKIKLLLSKYPDIDFNEVI